MWVQEDGPFVAKPQTHEVLVVELELAQPGLQGGDAVVGDEFH